MYEVFGASDVEHFQEFLNIFPDVVSASIMCNVTYPQQKAQCVDCLVLDMDEVVGIKVSDV